MTRVLAVAERARGEDTPTRYVEWEPWRWMFGGRLVAPWNGAAAFATGDATARRWAALRGNLDLPAINLLPPSDECGAWDAELASDRAGDLLAWAMRGRASLVLLGRRVERATCRAATCVYEPAAWGESFPVWGVPMLVLPHPSGRCRAWNDPAAAAALRAALARFVLAP